jgi:peptide/nickel transport system permease protein
MRRGFGERASVCFLAGLCLCLIFAEILAPYDPAEQQRDFPYAPPTRLHWSDAEGRFHFRPFVYGLKVDSTIGAFVEDRSQVFPVRFFARGETWRWLGIVPVSRRLLSVEHPGELFLLGADGLGRDQWSRLLYGGRITLLAGLFAATLALSLGVLMGSLAGYLGGWIDAALMRLVELFLAMPWLYLLLAARAFLPLRLSPLESFGIIVLILGLVGWARPARIVRGVVRSVRDQEFVLAARSAGAGTWFILARHVIPQAASVIRTQAALLVPQYMLAEVTLSYLGLGVNEPVASWGNMLQSVQQLSALRLAPWLLAPAVLMIPVFWAFSVLAEHTEQHLEFQHTWNPLAHSRSRA